MTSSDFFSIFENYVTLSLTACRSAKVHGLDCELVHTMNGLELAGAIMKGVLDNSFFSQYEIVIGPPPPHLHSLESRRRINHFAHLNVIDTKDLSAAITFEACRLQSFQFIKSETVQGLDSKAVRSIRLNVIDTERWLLSNVFSTIERSSTTPKGASPALAVQLVQARLQDNVVVGMPIPETESVHIQKGGTAPARLHGELT
ncbi:hypothetical protein B9Z55_022900 [Caenorhabditis nigoni]|uniref:Uncharacterized protein n=1 Tax=Caenorhabditis nigoni TaxID=1611254 RepID=A0A2G5SMS7_9PELO|nr:hypothetical protein B9Z55_022900 [Caenorhabditis nigoni]